MHSTQPNAPFCIGQCAIHRHADPPTIDLGHAGNSPVHGLYAPAAAIARGIVTRPARPRLPGLEFPLVGADGVLLVKPQGRWSTAPSQFPCLEPSGLYRLRMTMALSRSPHAWTRDTLAITSTPDRGRHRVTQLPANPQHDAKMAEVLATTLERIACGCHRPLQGEQGRHMATWAPLANPTLMAECLVSLALSPDFPQLYDGSGMASTGLFSDGHGQTVLVFSNAVGAVLGLYLVGTEGLQRLPHWPQATTTPEGD